MSFRAELEKLKPRDRGQEIANLTVAIVMGAIAYFWLKSPGFAFVFVPVIGLSSAASARGIGAFRTPRLFVLEILLIVAVLFVSLTVYQRAYG